MTRQRGKAHDLADLLRGRHLHEPPSGTLRRALALGAALEKAPTFAEWVVSLLFDSSAQPVPVGVRKGAAGAERRLLFALNAGAGVERRVDVRVRWEPKGTLEIAGQVLPPADALGVEAVVARRRVRAEVGAAGEFLLRGIAARGASVSLVLELADGTRVDVSVPLPDAPGARSGR